MSNLSKRHVNNDFSSNLRPVEISNKKASKGMRTDLLPKEARENKERWKSDFQKLKKKPNLKKLD